MSTFMDNLSEQLNVSITENGAIGYATTNKPLLDMNFKISSYRHMSEDDIWDDFNNAFNVDKVAAMKWLFYVRDVREGQGERRLFRVILNQLSNTYPEMVTHFLELVSEYGRWDDLIDLYFTTASDGVQNEVSRIIKARIDLDIEGVKLNESISLLAKWMPSENASSTVSKSRACKFMQILDMTPKQYRKTLSMLRKYLDVLEVKASANNWSEINYSSVPSKANLLYKNAFREHDNDRYQSYLDSVNKGEAKINTSVTFPHEIVHQYYQNFSGGVDSTLETLWKNLPNLVNEESSTMVVADGSGSMTSRVDEKSGVTALEIANALAIYFAERCSGEFKNKYITFSMRPQLVNLNGTTLRQNILIARKHGEIANTNIEAVFDLILQTAIDNNMKQEEIPKNILIISDMEFDACAADNSASNRYYAGVKKTLFKTLNQRFIDAGYTMPRLIFWNVNSRTCTIPVKENENGVALVSGFSVNTMKMVMSNELDPYKALLSILNTDRYQVIEDIFIANNL